MLPGFLEEHPRTLSDERIAELRERLLEAFGREPTRPWRSRPDRPALAARRRLHDRPARRRRYEPRPEPARDDQ